MDLFDQRDRGAGEPAEGAATTEDSNPAARPAPTGVASPEERTESTTVQDPELARDDPRQLLFSLLSASPLATVFHGPGEFEVLLHTALRAAPVLARSSTLGKGFMRLDADPNTLWAVVADAQGAALVVVPSPESDTGLFIRDITVPLERCPAPWKYDFLTQRSGSPEAIARLTDVDLVPPWEVAGLFPSVPDHFPVMPMWARRAARGWDRVLADLYRTSVTDSDGDEVTVFLTLDEGHPHLLYPFTSSESGDLSPWASVATDTHRLQWLEPGVALGREVPHQTGPAQLVALTQELVDQVAAGLRARHTHHAAAGPAAVTKETAVLRSLWERVETGPAGTSPSRRVDWDLAGAEFTVTEMIRNTLPDSETLPADIDKYMVADEWARALRPVRGAGFEHTWRDDSDRRLDPSWVTLQSAAVDPATGRVAAAGRLTHENWGLSPAYDLGAITGSNGMSWPAKGHVDGLPYPTTCLYVGSLASGTLAPVDAQAPIVSVDLDPATGTIAVLESLGNVGALAIHGPSGERHRLTVINDSSTGSVRFSLDGRWLLVPRHDGSLLCEVDTGRHLQLPVTNCGWWPLADSTLLEFAHESGKVIPRLFDLESNAYVHEFPQVTLQEGWLPGLEYAWRPAASPDGTEVLVQSPAGVSVEYRGLHAVGHHLAKISLHDGRGGLVRPALLDESRPWERDVAETRWVGPFPVRSVRLHPDLSGRLQEPVLDHEYLAADRYSPEAEEFLVKTLNHAIELTQNDAAMAHLMPEILMSMATLAADPARWQKREQWFTNLSDATGNMCESGELTGPSAAAWRHFATAVTHLLAGQPELIDPVAATWV